MLDITEALDLPRPGPTRSDDPYRFEFGVRGDSGQPLRIDLYKRDCFILEAKQSRLSADKGEAAGDDLFPDLSPERPRNYPRRSAWRATMRAAFGQAWDYANRLPAGHDRPPFLLTCDVGRTFELYSDFTGQGRDYRPYERRRLITLEELRDDDAQDLLRAVWTEPRTLDPALERARITREVAGHIAEVSRALEGQGKAPEEVAGFLSRCLFAMFAQNVGLLPAHSVTRLLRECLEAPGSFMMAATDLFRAMDTGGDCVAIRAVVTQFNGAFFKDRRAYPLAREHIGALLEAAGKDWSQVEPAIFGTLLEQALSPGERARLGAHYTPRPYVERLVGATIMEPLRAEWRDARAGADALLDTGDPDGARAEVLGFHQRLMWLRVLDPACGTGNFLYVALERMKELEDDVLSALRTLEDHAAVREFEALRVRGVDPRQFLGLELNPRAASIAELVLWIGYLQASFRRNAGYGARTPVLEDYGNIQRRDAVLGPDGARPVWPEADYIVGNPPFIGGKDVRAELGGDYAEALWAAHPHMNPSADLVMYWWDRAADILTREGSRLKRFGLVTTNSITQVFQRRTVARWLAADNPNRRPLSLVFAVDDHPWTKATRDAAAVRIAMTTARAGAWDGELLSVVRESGLETDQPVVETRRAEGRIGADLTVGVDVTRAKPLLANHGLCSRGVALHGAGFIVSPTEAEHLGLLTVAERAAVEAGRPLGPTVPGGRIPRPGLEAHIRPYLNGRDLTARSRGKLVIDLFGLSAEQVRERYPEVYQQVSTTVRFDYGPDGRTPRTDDGGRRLGREWNARETYKANWWLLGEPRSEMRPALAGLPRYIATVETAKHRAFVFVEGAVLPDNMLVVVAADDAAHLAVISSRTHVLWASEQGGTLEDRPRYSKSRCFDPFPFPAWTETQRAALADAGEALDAFRKARLAERPELTLTRLYNALEAHRAGRAMTPVEAADFGAGSVLILAELHEAVDRLTLEAYGWPAGEGEQAVLGRLVALNAERAAQESRGDVRWLRPDYQRPRFGRAAVAGPQAAGDLVGVAPESPAGLGREPWPKRPGERVWAVRSTLAEARAPLPAVAVAARFKGRGVLPDVERTLRAMQREGQVRGGPGGYALLRTG